MNDPQPEGHMASHIGRRKFLATLGGRGGGVAARGARAAARAQAFLVQLRLARPMCLPCFRNKPALPINRSTSANAPIPYLVSPSSGRDDFCSHTGLSTYEHGEDKR